MAPIDPAGFPPNPVTRFAPSPTGYLHLGHAVNAAWTWGTARKLGGKVLLRIEDHDRGRCRPEYEVAILEDLAWLGFAPDDPGPPRRQSEHDADYQAALETVRARAHVYACRCSRAEIARRMREDGLETWDELRYPGICRQLGLPFTPGHGIRVELPPDPVEFEDLRSGPQRQTPAEQCGDLLLRDAGGNWTYQFCVVVDDLLQGVNLVVRGEDLLPSTGRQILLARMLGRNEPPRFLHHPLVRDGNGMKLSKRDGAARVRSLGRATIDERLRAATDELRELRFRAL